MITFESIQIKPPITSNQILYCLTTNLNEINTMRSSTGEAESTGVPWILLGVEEIIRRQFEGLLVSIGPLLMNNHN